MDMMTEAVLIGGLLPFSIALLGFLLGLWWRNRGQEGLAQFSAALGLGMGFFAGYAFSSWTTLTPQDSWHWLPYFVLGAMLVGLLSTLAWPVRFLGALALALTAARLLIPDYENLEQERLWWQAVLAMSIVGTWLVADRAMRLRRTDPWGACWVLSFMALAALMKFIDIMMFVQLAGLFLAGVTVYGLADVKQNWRGLLPGAAPLLALALPSLLVLGKVTTFSEVPLSSYGWLLAGPWSCCVVSLLLPETWSWRRRLVAFACLLGCLGWALFQAWEVAGTPQM